MKQFTYQEFLIHNEISASERFGNCDYCDGDGRHECECGDVHECKHCGGKGKVDILRPVYDKLCEEQARKWEEWHKEKAEVTIK